MGIELWDSQPDKPEFEIAKPCELSQKSQRSRSADTSNPAEYHPFCLISMPLCDACEKDCILDFLLRFHAYDFFHSIKASIAPIVHPKMKAGTETVAPAEFG